MREILCGVRHIEWLQANPHIDSSANTRIILDHAVEFGRAYKENREQTAIFVLEIHESTEFREDFRRHDLCIIDHENGVSAIFADDRKLFVDLSEEPGSIRSRLFGTELSSESLQYSRGIGRAWQHHQQRGFEDFLLEGVEDSTGDQGLTHAAIACE
jgi:hypothetical protein